ncbi:MAG: glycine C-acetyltransferase [Sedimentisphaerales bacterium]|nr:glycine C-acetyltransferase [Sedimentisphaerales bacterium]
MQNPILSQIQNEIDSLRNAGTYKTAPVICGPMNATVKLSDNREVINLCSNNYLGLADHPEVVAQAKKAMDKYGNGTASVRFICGTFDIHLELESAIAKFLNTESSTTYVSCWNANEALVPTLLAPGDVVISDELNHASIIDASRLCSKKVGRFIYHHNDMNDLERILKENESVKRKLIITDGVFSMEGDLANLKGIVDLAQKYNAITAVDDSHAHGVIGKTGCGTPEHFGVEVDIITGTLGKALGGAAGGFVASSKPIIELLVQRSRPQLFSNALPPATAAGALAAIKILANEPQRLKKLHQNVKYLRDGLGKLGYQVIESPTAIIPVIVGQTAKAIRLANKMLEHNILITGFGYPVVPEGTARLRAQVSAAHDKAHLDKALMVFKELKKET